MTEKTATEKFTKYERARILGARSLQIAMNAPLLVKISKEDLEKIRYDSLKIAEIELESGILPISIKRPFPERRGEKLRRVVERKVEDESVEKKEMQEEEEIVKEGEIMELANPEDESEGEVEEESGDET